MAALDLDSDEEVPGAIRSTLVTLPEVGRKVLAVVRIPAKFQSAHVVQLYLRPGNIVRFQIPRGLNASTHSFAWKPDSVFCQSLKGIHGARGTSRVIAEHTFTQDIPRAGGENARINLWLMDGHPLIDGKETEIIVSKFEFVPSPK